MEVMKSDYTTLPILSLFLFGFSNLFLGCQIEIWKDYAETGDYFKCSGLDNGHWCRGFNYVGDDEASSIKCTCPVDFERIVYDIPQNQWGSIIQHDQQASTTRVEVDRIRLPNKCNLGGDRCNDPSLNVQEDPKESITMESTHNWGHIFKAGVSYTAGVSVKLGGFRMNESITISAEETSSTGGSKTVKQTIEASGTCTAPPNAVAYCTYFAYQSTIKVGYTIFWKNSSPSFVIS